MIHAGMLLASGLIMMLWRPCRSREARAPRLAVAMLLLAPLAVWVGSFGVAVGVAAGDMGDPLRACGVLWRQVVAGDAAWWRAAPLLTWLGVFTAATARHALVRRRSRSAVREAVRAALSPGALPRLFVVPCLGTPAVTVGFVRPRVLVDEGFWNGASTRDRAVVVDHERAHQRGRHALVESVAALLTAPLAPLWAAREVYDCVRRHLEALADDAAVRRHGADTVGQALGAVALGRYPLAGVGASGDCVWRVQRLVAPAAKRSWRDGAFILLFVVMMAGHVITATDDIATALGPVSNPDVCVV